MPKKKTNKTALGIHPCLVNLVVEIMILTSLYLIAALLLENSGGNDYYVLTHMHRLCACVHTSKWRWCQCL